MPKIINRKNQRMSHGKQTKGGQKKMKERRGNLSALVSGTHQLENPNQG